jgi:hypothetical protein
VVFACCSLYCVWAGPFPKASLSILLIAFTTAMYGSVGDPVNTPPRFAHFFPGASFAAIIPCLNVINKAECNLLLKARIYLSHRYCGLFLETFECLVNFQKQVKPHLMSSYDMSHTTIICACMHCSVKTWMVQLMVLLCHLRLSPEPLSYVNARYMQMMCARDVSM